MNGEPVPSSPLIGEPPSGARRHTLAPWPITAVRLHLEAAIDLLSLCVNAHALATGLFVGCDIAFAAASLQLAAGIVVRQEYLPDLEEEGAEFRAVWTPVIAGPQQQRLSALARAMPGACRAVSLDDEAPPGIAPSVLLRAFVASLVDRLVRRAAPAETARAPSSFDSVYDEWVHALRSTDGTLRGPTAALAHLAARVREWQRPIRAAAGAPFRLTFRLEEPKVKEEHPATNGGGPWHVRYLRYLLQATPRSEPARSRRGGVAGVAPAGSSATGTSTRRSISWPPSAKDGQVSPALGAQVEGARQLR